MFLKKELFQQFSVRPTTTQETFVGHTEKTNLIDSNGNGNWDYQFDEANGLTPYEVIET